LEAVQNPLLLSLTRSLPYDVDVCCRKLSLCTTALDSPQRNRTIEAGLFLTQIQVQ